jgi:hypothetical protein
MTAPRNTGRDAYLVRQALAVAIEALSELPASRRPHSDIMDMYRLLVRWVGAAEARWYLEQERLAARALRTEDPGARGGG